MAEADAPPGGFAMIYGVTSQGVAAVPANGAARYLATQRPENRFHATVIAPAGADVIDLFTIIDPAAALPRAARYPSRPTIVLIGDDPGGPDGAGGPPAWQCAQQLRRWVAAALIHGAGGLPEHYAEAVRGALVMRRVALIETCSANAMAWAEHFDCPHTLLILPRTGPHPLPLAEAVE